MILLQEKEGVGVEPLTLVLVVLQYSKRFHLHILLFLLTFCAFSTEKGEKHAFLLKNGLTTYDL